MAGVSTEFALPAPGEPCRRCNVRAYIGCKHQPATGVAPPAIASDEEIVDTRRTPRPGAGFNFRVAKVAR